MSSLIIPQNEFNNNIKLITELLEEETKTHINNEINETKAINETNETKETLNLEDLDKIDTTIDNTINENNTETNSINNFKQIDKTKVSLCLNMIVRNESKIITY